jgi:flagellar basal-body rod modification protein FlgD
MSAISAPTAARPSTINAYDTLTSDDFIRVMFAELTRQDPSKPTDSKDLLEQLSTIRSIESDLSLTRRLDEITRRSEINSAGGLVGKFVEGLTDAGERTRGFVDSVSITREGIVLNLSSEKSIALDRLDKVFDPALVQPAGGGGTTP